MARIYSESGPAKANIKDAERRVYELFKLTLSDDYFVFHGVTWAAKADDGSLTNGQVDFIVAHPQHGVLLLEIKGGGISYDPANKQWNSRDRESKIHQIKDLYDQVSSSVHVLKRHLGRVPATKRFAKQYWLSYGVWFPDIDWTPGSVTLMQVKDELTLDARDMANPEPGLLRLFTYNRKRTQHAISSDGMGALIDVLAPTIKIKSKMGVQMRDEQRQFDRLTDDQFRKLDTMSRHPRVCVRGAAGTGKTVLALEKTRRLAGQGLHVLFVCVSPSQALAIQSLVEGAMAELKDYITVHHIEGLCLELSGNAGITLDSLGADSMLGSSEELAHGPYQAKLGALLSRSVNRLIETKQLTTYDAIVVDEAQDIDRPLWTPIFKLLEDKRNGKLLVFYDPAQRDGEGDWSPPIPNGYRELVLTENCRNTQTIFRIAQEFYTGIEPPTCLGPEGRAVWCLEPMRLVDASTPAGEIEAAALETVLDRLIDGEGIRPEAILVITCRSQRTSNLYRRRFIGKHLLNAHAALTTPGHVTITTVRTSKGLERSVIVLAELDGISKANKRDVYLYVAISRAMHHLAVLGSRKALLPRRPIRQPALWTAQTCTHN